MELFEFQVGSASFFFFSCSCSLLASSDLLSNSLTFLSFLFPRVISVEAA